MRLALVAVLACGDSAPAVPAVLTCDDGSAPFVIESFDGATAMDAAACGSGQALVGVCGPMTGASFLERNNGQLSMISSKTCGAGCSWANFGSPSSLIVEWTEIGDDNSGIPGRGVSTFGIGTAGIDVSGAMITTGSGSSSVAWNGEDWWRIRHRVTDDMAVIDISTDAVTWTSVGTGAWPTSPEVGVGVNASGSLGTVGATTAGIYGCR